MAKVDPFVIQWPAKWMADNEIRPVIEYLNRFLHDLFIRTGGGEDLVDDANVGESVNQSTAALASAKIGRLEKRIESLESRDDGVNSKIARLNRIMEALLNELLAEVKNLRDVELENKSLCVLQGIQKELELLNERTEEGLETGINEDDIE